MLQALAREVSRTITGLTIRGLVDERGGGVVLLTGKGSTGPIQHRLLIVPESGRARLHLIEPPTDPQKTKKTDISALARDAAQWLQEGVITGVSAPQGERWVSISFAVGGQDRRLVAELFGNAPNLLLVDEKGTIRALKRRRGGGRPASQGAPFLEPPPRPGPSEIPEEEHELTPPTPDPDSTFAMMCPWSAHVSGIYRGQDEEADALASIRGLKQRVGPALKKTTALEARLKKELVAADEAPRLRQLADLLSSHFADLRKGMTELEVEDLYLEGNVVIPLNPKKEPRENVDALYHRAKKLTRGRSTLIERIETNAKLLKLLRDLASEIEDLEEHGNAAGPDLEARVEKLVGKPQRAKTRAPEKRREPSAGIRRFVLLSGLEAWVGKSNQDNDYLTVRIARGNDIWLHIEGGSGSHVVIRLPRGKTASLDDLLDGAALATHFSRRRGAEKAEVLYTPRKYVRKPKGSPPGRVTVDRKKTILIANPEERFESRLNRTTDDDDGLQSLG